MRPLLIALMAAVLCFSACTPLNRLIGREDAGDAQQKDDRQKDDKPGWRPEFNPQPEDGELQERRRLEKRQDKMWREQRF